MSGWSITATTASHFLLPGWLSGVFTPNGSGGYSAPPQFQADLVTVSGGGWTLTDHVSQTKLAFNSAGRLTSVQDRNHNPTTFNYTSTGLPASVGTTRGPNAQARTLTIATSGGRITTLSQSDGSHTRSVRLGYSSGGHLASVTDTIGGVTGFATGSGTDTGQVVTITNPAGSTTTLGFSGSKASQVSQSNTAPGSPGTSITRLAYPSSTQTLVADPTTDQSQPVASVPHTTYDLTTDGSMLVSSATDADGHTRLRTYTPLQDIASSTPASGGSTTFSYGANNGESLTNIALPGGANESAAYTNTGAAKYLPSSTTDDGHNTLQYTYDGQGNQLTTAQGTSGGPQAKVTYNSDGTAKTSQSPGAASGVQTSYGYDANHDLTSITPPSETSLGTRNFTWDSFGRLATATDGAGHTTTYSYDDADRITSVSYSDGTPTVTYTYDPLNRVTQRVDASGTTTYSYDDLGKLLSTTNTGSAAGDAGSGTISYRYDLAGALASETNDLGTTSYGYDAAHLLTSMTYPSGSGTATVQFANDPNGRRTDTWLASNANHSSWAAHTHLSYDSTGRVTEAYAERGPASAPTKIFDETVCYSAGSTAPSCPTTPSADRTNIQWVSDSVSGETTAYTYDSSGRLTKSVVTGAPTHAPIPTATTPPATVPPHRSPAPSHPRRA